MIGLGNVFCILSGLLLGPVYGGLAAGVGSGVFDLVGGWASSAPTTLINKFMMAFVCGAIAWSGRSEGRRLYRVIAGAVSGSLTYCVLYLFKSFVEAKLEGSADEAMAILLGTKAAATIVNAVIADVVAVPLALAIRRSLESNRMYLGLVESSAAQLEGHDLRRGVAVTLLLVQSVLQIVCVAALLPSVQSAAAESGGGADGLAVLGCGSLLSGAGRVRCFSGAPERFSAPVTALCAVISVAFSVWFLIAGVQQAVLAKYLPIGVVFLVILLAAIGFLLPTVQKRDA